MKENFESMAYAPAPESRDKVDAWLGSHQAKMGMFIGGSWVAGQTHFASYAPSTGEKLADIASATQEQVDSAVAASRLAQPKWAALGGHGRARVLYALARLLQKHSRFMAVLESLDNGKPIRESRDIDIPLAARHFYHHAGWAQLIDDELPDHIPLGVAGQVIPWNFPLLMLAWKVAPALAAGNTVVLKPAEYTSLTALKFAELCQEAGLPKGVVNIVTGAGDVGAMVVASSVDKIAFTGSTAVGKIIRRSVAGSGKKLTLELGGKSPFIVFDDADIDGAVEGLVDAIWFNQGQVCCAGSRLLVQEGIAENFIARVKQRMQKLRVGDSLDKCTDIGAIVDQVQKDQIEAMLNKGVAEGATIFQPACEIPASGLYLPPTLITDIGSDSPLMQEEIFGPVLSAMTFRTQLEAVQLANNTRYGLAASVWSESLSRALEVAPAIKAGVVWINGTNMFDAAVGFGGMRESGYGREGGIEGMKAYMTTKSEKAREKWTMPKRPPELVMPKSGSGLDAIDQTAKHYIGGKQVRPDGGGVLPVSDIKGSYMGTVADGNYKDIRNAVESATKAQPSWAGQTAHLRAQILYYIAENLNVRADEFAARIRKATGVTAQAASSEVENAVVRLFEAAAWADKLDGRVHQPPMRGVALAMNEAVGVIGIVCPVKSPLLGLAVLAGHAIAQGNAVVVIPSGMYPLVATDFYQILETSDLPNGVLNIVTGNNASLAPTLAKHYGIDGLWYFGHQSKEMEQAAAENMKRTWLCEGYDYAWGDKKSLPAAKILSHAVEVKNIWVTYGDANQSSGGY